MKGIQIMMIHLTQLISQISEYNNELNNEISNEEILVTINSLNNNKACSVFDNILNEYIKHSKDIMLSILKSFFQSCSKQCKYPRNLV